MNPEEKLQSLINESNSATGETDETITDAMQTLVDGFNQEYYPITQVLTVTENGTYIVPAGVDGYSSVTVNVSVSGSNDWNLLGVSATRYFDEFMRAHPLPVPQTGYKMIMIKVVGSYAESGSATLVEYIIPLINGAPFWADSAQTKMKSIVLSMNGGVAPDTISTSGSWSIRTSDEHSISEQMLNWRSGISYFLGSGNSVYYKVADWR